MVELIFVIAIIAYIVKAAQKADENQKRQANANKNPWEGTYQAPKQATRIQSAREQVKQQTTQAVQEQIAKTKQRIMESRGMTSSTTIVDRAKANVEEKKVDVTLETMEAEHNHSERVSAAVHHHPEDVMPENMLGNIEDLMIKGYDGNLCFERDFVGEGLDMISRFTV